MPIQDCQVDGKPGWRWGASGKCYTGKRARARALRQARAIKRAQKGRRATANVTANIADKFRKRSPNPLRRDPSRTATLRRAFETAISRRLRSLKRAIWELVVEEDAFGLRQQGAMTLHERNDEDGRATEVVQAPEVLVDNIQDAPNGPVIHRLTPFPRFQFRTAPEKVDEFLKWLRDEIDGRVFDAGLTSEPYWEAYIREGYEKGVGRAFDDSRKYEWAKRWEPGQGEFYAGTKREFLRSTFALTVSKEKVKLIAGRVFAELKDISESMSAHMVRELTDGLVQGKNPREVARRMIDKGIGTKRRGVQSRALTIARTETIRAHSEGQLDAMERLGVEEVGVAVEWSTSGLGITVKGNPSPCPQCAPLGGMVLKISEARGMLPRHPNCLCTFIPANVGEDTEGQKRSKASLRDAIRRSVGAESGRRSAREQMKRTTWGGADTKVGKRRPRELEPVL